MAVDLWIRLSHLHRPASADGGDYELQNMKTFSVIANDCRLSRTLATAILFEDVSLTASDCMDCYLGAVSDDAP